MKILRYLVSFRIMNVGLFGLLDKCILFQYDMIWYISKNICTYIHMKNLLKKAQVIKLFFWFRPLRFICQLNGTVLWWQVPMQNMVNVVKTLYRNELWQVTLILLQLLNHSNVAMRMGFCVQVSLELIIAGWKHEISLVGCSNYSLNFKYKYRKSP